MGKRVLVIDDALIMRMRIKEIAAGAGWEIAGEAGDGEEGLARYRELAPDLTTLRAYGGLQSYPSRTKDPDQVDFSTGSVGIGATATIWSALAHRYASQHVPTAPGGRHIALVGDAELDEGAVWEALVDPMVGRRPRSPPRGPGQRLADPEVLGHRQVREDPRVLWRVPHSGEGPLVRGQTGDIPPPEGHPSAPDRQEAHHAVDGGGLAGPVAPEQGHRFARRHPQRDPVQHVAVAVVGVDGFDVEHAHALPR